jgi:UDP-N-acetylglucosamine 2-epimerase (non-hydrolysing)
MKKLKLVTVVGTRPEIIRLSRVLDKLDKSSVIEHILVHTGQNYDYELNQVFFEDLGLRMPEHFLNAAGKTASQTIGQILIAVDVLLDELKPDTFLVLGDTNSCLCAIPAKKKHIPVFHMEAGNRCFDQRVPEEINRKIVDHIADINLTYSDISREYLLREGLPPDRIIKTGSPMFEVMNYYLPKIKQSTIVEELKLSAGNYFLVSCHREENVNDPLHFRHFIEILNNIATRYQLPVIVSTHPRTRQMIEREKIKVQPEVQFLKPFGFSDYNALQLSARVVLSDSGTISEESSILNFPALNIREAHERPEAMEEAGVMMVGLNPERVLQGISVLDELKPGERKFRLVADYSMPNVSDKVERIIVSYTDYIKRVVWQEPPSL